MAKICFDNIERLEKTRNTLHEKAVATYTVFEKDGEKYFQLDTYGKPDRENPEKISQSIQLDEAAAKKLVRLLIQEFELI